MPKRQTIAFTDEGETDLVTIKEHLKAFTGSEPTDNAAVTFALRFTARQIKPTPKPPAKARRRPR